MDVGKVMQIVLLYKEINLLDRYFREFEGLILKHFLPNIKGSLAKLFF